MMKKRGKLYIPFVIDNFKRSVVFAISLEQLTDFSPTVQQFNSLDFQLQGEPVLFISIDDLRAYRDLSNGVIEFFHFLTERNKGFL